MSKFTVTVEKINDSEWAVTINGWQSWVTSSREAIKRINTHFWAHNWSE